MIDLQSANSRAILNPILQVEETSSKCKAEKPSASCLAIGSIAISALLIGSYLIGSYLGDSQPDLLARLKIIANSTNPDICQDSILAAAVCKGNLGIPRAEMPQVEGEVLENYLQSLAAKNITVSVESVNSETLTPTQSEMHAGKILSLVKATLSKAFDACKSPILVGENYVIDGHHRYAACRVLNLPMTISRIKQSIGAVLASLKTFPGVTTEAFNVGIGVNVKS